MDRPHCEHPGRRKGIHCRICQREYTRGRKAVRRALAVFLSLPVIYGT
jgi:hypothetical protein